MAAKKTEELLKKIETMLGEHCVGDYVLAVRDPDDNVDCLRVSGSVWWRVGLATELVEDYKFDRKREWEAQVEENDDEDA